MLHKKFYEAITSNEVELLKTLLQVTTDASHNNEDVRLILAQVYEEIKTKNIPVSPEIDFLVTYKLVDTNFFIPKPKNDKSSQENKLTIENVIARIEIIRECSLFLINNYSNKRMDDNFAQRIKIITQHTSILKKYLKTSYQQLPWEELEFCLLMLLIFISEPTRSVNIYKLVLDKDRVLNYLKTFIEVLSRVSSNFQKNDVNPRVHFPSRETLLKSVLTNNPAFKNLYEDYEIVRDIYSLSRIDYYIQQSLNFTSENIELQKLLIQRTLQVIGEYLKNSTESPNVSNHVHKVLSASAPNDLKDIITSLRDSLSHAHSLIQRLQIEETQNDLFDNLQDNLRTIQGEISLILNKRRIDAFASFSNKIKECRTIEEAKYLLSEIALRDLKFTKLDSEDFVVKEVTKIKELISDLSNLIPDKTWEEIQQFNMIEEYLNLQLEKVGSSENTHKRLLSLFSRTVYDMKHSNNLEYIRKIFSNVLNQLIRVLEKKDLNYFSRVSYHINEIQRSLHVRKPNSKEIKEVDDFISHILITLDMESSSVKKIHEFKTDLEKDEDIIPDNSKEIDMLIKSIIELEISSDLKVKISNGYEEKKQIPKIKADLFSMLEDVRQGSYIITEDDEKQWEELLKLKSLDLKKATKDNLILYYKDKNIKGCENLINIINDSYTALLKSFNDHNIFINTKQQTALKSFLTSLKLKKNDIEDTMKKFMQNLQDNIETFFTKRFNILKDLLIDVDSQSEENVVRKFIQDESLQIIVEALMLDLLQILEDMSFFTDNRLFIDDYTPVLIGKALRNYLAHGNVFLDLIPIQSSMSVLCNALKVIKCGENIIDIKDSLIGKNNFYEDSFIKNRNFESLKYIETQSEMFLYAAKNDTEKIKECISNGASVFANTLDGCNALHFAAKTDSLESFKFFINQGLDKHLRNSSDLEPIHLAAIHGSKEIMDYFIEHNFPIKTLQNGRSIVHLVAKHGHVKILEELLKLNYEINVRNTHDLTPLHLSSEHGHIEIVKLLLSNGANISDETKCYSTALLYASRNGHKEIVKLLLEYEETKKFVNKQSSNGNTPLHWAVANGHIDVVTILLASEADILLTNYRGFTSLCISVQNGHFDIFKLLYHSVENKQLIDKKELLEWSCYNGYPLILTFLLETGEDPNDSFTSGLTLLHIAIDKGQENVIKPLLASGADANLANNDKFTPLHMASQNGYVNIVNDLLDVNAKVDCLDNKGMTPLCLAVLFGNTEIMDILIRKGADVNLTAIKKITPLLAAVNVQDHELVNNLLQAGAKVNAQTDKGISPLHLACCCGLYDIVCSLLRAGADVNMLAENNYTPLHIACREGHVMVATTLLNENANVNATTIRKTKSETIQDHNVIFSHLWYNCGALLNVNGITPLHLAAQGGSYDIALLLINKGAQFDLPDEQKVTPLVLAAQQGHLKLVKLFISKGADVNILMKNNLTPLMSAVQADYKKIVETLLKAGALKDLANKDGYTSLHYAAMFNYNNILSILLDYGANPDCYTIYDCSPLHLAALKGNKEGVAILVNKGADVNANCYWPTPLEFAIYCGNREIVQFLCENGALINFDRKTRVTRTIRNIEDEETKQVLETLDKSASSTPLLTAISCGSHEIVCDLLSYGADPNIPDLDDKYPLHVACLAGQTNTVRKLLDFHANIEARSSEGFTPLLAAIQGNHIDVVKVLLNAKATVDVKTVEGATPLTMAIVRGSEEIIEELLNHGVNIDERFNDLTPLYLACKHEFVGKARVLLEHGADVNIATNQLWTPLHVAASSDNAELVSLLLDYQAEFRITIEGISPLHLASQNGCANVITLLLSSGDNVNVRAMEDNATPLYLSSFYGHLEVVEILLDRGADLHIPTTNGLTPLHGAIIRNHPAVVRRLLRSKADPNIETNFIYRPLDLAIIKFNMDIICDLLIYGAIINEESEHLMINEKIKRGIAL